MLVGTGGPGALQTSPEWAETVLERDFPTSAGRGWEGGEMHNFRKNLMLVGAGGPGALQTSSPARSLGRVDTDPHAALRALLVGLRPPTPQSPERLRSTPFDCVAIAPCCFAFRKAVLSHALAALTALNKSASQVEREAIAAMNALNKSASQVEREAIAAMNALNKSASQVEREAIAAMNALLTQTVANVILRTKQPFPPRQKPRHGCGRRSG